MGLVCNNSNMRDLTQEDINNGRSHRCSIEDPCDCCFMRLGRIKFKELRNIDKSSKGQE